MRFLADDHRRLMQLLQTAVTSAGHVVQGTYDHFRAGLLRHIGMEEEILLPAARRWNGGQPLSIATKLRLDHGAIAALLMPTPTTDIMATLLRILEKHNLVEEGPDGGYEICDRLPGTEADTDDPASRHHGGGGASAFRYSVCPWSSPPSLGASRLYGGFGFTLSNRRQFKNARHDRHIDWTRINQADSTARLTRLVSIIPFKYDMVCCFSHHDD